MTKRVLVVDDDPGIRDVLKEVLTAEGFEVATISSPKEVLLTWGGMLPEVIVLDSVSTAGEMTGAELAEWLHRSVVIPIVFFTGKVTRELESLANQLGAEIVAKPDISALVEALRTA